VSDTGMYADNDVVVADPLSAVVQHYYSIWR